MIVVVQHFQRVGVVRHHLEQRGRLVAAQRAAMCHVGDQAHRLVEFLQPLRMDGVALHQVLAQHVGGPDAELGAALGLDPVTYRNDDVEVVEDDGLVRASNMHFLHIAFLWQFTFREHIAHMPGNDRLITLE